ncbi:TetR/AcrR family transcriptional regulator [Roseovarius sp. SCSIO 43702]|uniref:TetR/AcrR family transcriptional regulator n=1 Tax=Roseovarius sp. SCSIO 43702 TaxID=2823043 RepID=UPI001C72FF1C|nr:TetR/AcrR family transcriptional regulator [Roseovarius sp. SCSIO 43702]QYX58259.1 TetR/AcrR family transcriptional regulator [Roseovarius sp. SCSIO 43702]
MTDAPRRSLTRADWLAAGRAALAASGPSALAAEPLARALGTTKGSFYWHFRDLPAFQDALISHWEAGALTALTEPSGDTAPERLRALAAIIATPDATETAMRSWALGRPAAAEALARVDGARLDLLHAHLRAIGIGNRGLARILRGAATGIAALGDESDGDDIVSLVDLILALR